MNIWVISLVVALATGLPSISFGEDTPPISILCPCKIENLDQTRDVATFSIVFNKEVSESGDFRLDLNLRESLLAPAYWELSRAPMARIPYSSGRQMLSVTLPRPRKSPIDEGFLDLTLVSGDRVLDRVVMNYDPIQYGDYSGSQSVDDPFTFESSVKLEYDSSGLSLQIDEVRNSLLKNTSETLTVKVVAADFETFYSKFSSDVTVAYDSEGVGSIAVSGPLNTSIDSHLAFAPGHTRLQLQLLRGDTLLVEYLLEAIGDGVMPSFDLNLANVDTLLDSDRDGISDFNENLVGTSESEITTFAPTLVEIAFTYGSAAFSQQGTELPGRIAHITAVANAVFSDSGVEVTFQNTGQYAVGDDTALDADQVTDGIADRSGIFANLDEALDRKPDLFIHLSTGDVLGIGGLAFLQGRHLDGVINHESIYSNGTNVAAVAIDNTATTLAHEIGHLMGLDHSRRQAMGSPNGTFPWSLGHAIDGDFATLMAYATEFGNATEFEFFSSPDLSCGDSSLPCGVARNDYLAGADSVLTLRTTMQQIAAISNGFQPHISLAGESTTILTVGARFSEPGFAAMDKEDGTLTSAVVLSGEVNTGTVGTYTVTYSVIDSDQNTATATRSVVVAPDLDGDGISDVSDKDRDGDGFIDAADIFPDDASEWYDSDADGVGDNADTDDDNDGFSDGYEVSKGADPLDKNSIPKSGLNILLIKAALDLKKANEESCVGPDCVNSE